MLNASLSKKKFNSLIHHVLSTYFTVSDQKDSHRPQWPQAWVGLVSGQRYDRHPVAGPAVHVRGPPLACQRRGGQADRDRARTIS